MVEEIKDWWNNGVNRKYEVTSCSAMPSLKGMILVGKPQKGKTIFIGKNKEFRTLNIIKVLEIENGVEIYTEHLIAELKRLK